jgi:methyl-accepting chemotaxis protein WspA
MSENDSKKEGHFVRPESDGIRNGVPSGDDRNKSAEASELTSDGLNQRMKKAIVKVQGDLSPSFVGGDLLRTSGVSIKTKLIASLSVLTLLIIVIGFIAISSILEINAVSVNIADRQGALAKYTEEVKVSLFRAREAEKDFLILEEQESLARSGRYITKLRSQLEKATNVGVLIETATGVKLGSNYARMAEAVDSYESQFAEQVKNVLDARADINKTLDDAAKAEALMAEQADILRSSVKYIVDNFWIDVKRTTETASITARTVAVENARLIDVGKSEADDLLIIQGRLATDKFIKDADDIIQESARVATAQGVGSSSSSSSVNENARNAAAAAAVKEKAIEAQLKVADTGRQAAALAASTASIAATAAFDVTIKENAKVSVAVNFGNQLSNLDREMLAMQIQVSRYLLVKKAVFADAALASVDAGVAIIDAIRRDSENERLTLQMNETRRSLIEYKKLFADSVALANEGVVFSKTLALGIDIQKSEMKKTGDDLIGLVNELSDSAWATIGSQSKELQATAANAQNSLGFFVALGVIIGLFVLYAVPRPILAAINQLLAGAQRVAAGDLTQPVSVSSRDEMGQLANTFDHMRANLLSLVERIQRSSVQISNTVSEIQSAASQQATTAIEQAGALNEFSVTVNEIAQTAGQLAVTASMVADNSSGIAVKVGDANGRSNQMMDSMNAIGESTRQTSDRIKALNDQMDSISDSVTAISSIADQTTLLSLNAAIEANKAGEMGKGFSVVATEIRRLSDRSIDSAGGISTMVRDIQRATESSVVSMDKSSEEIRMGIDLVEESTNMMADVNESMADVGSRTKDIAASVDLQASASAAAQRTINEMLMASNVAVQSARQTSSSSYELSSMATQLSEAVSAFRT